MPGGDAARDQGFVALEINQPHVGAIADENIAVSTLERRAGDDAVSPGTAPLVNPGSDRIQPGPAILIGEGNAAMHLVDVGSGMKPIGVRELPSKTRCQERADG